MRKALLLLAALTLALTTAGAQTARSVLDQTAAKLKAAGGVKATFQATTFDGAEAGGSESGTIYIKGRMFHIDSPRLLTWFDGTTQWSYLEGSGEVNVSHPTEAELQSMNPYTFVDLYKQGYRSSLKSATLRGKDCYEVSLVATDSRKAIRQMVLTLEKGSLAPLCVRLRQGDDRWTRISIYDYTPGQSWKDDFFRFPQQDYPQVEIIDLR